ncbi:ATP-binding cassette domain-containing protein [Modestobacter marinus]|uniref:D-methionine transport system ATP-binding protein n=1 Tax=Modestobacter marinus TaxID=477641 RepID=A0A846LS30_9ACTN|nr:methionine ABC transporter ATP-binding protein [Modestobacter marinus]NIH66279.1 D-methionine transport system ATP-binding protein [Modestobacter marinus]GGL62397.1 methionine import ATP-binding protein MetN [Modestobacter marinus]
MIELSDVRKVFPARRTAGEVVALDGVSLSVSRGEFAGVVGPSGSGKSTLARLVNLLERPTSGTVTVDGRVLTDLDAAGVREARRSIGMIFQHFNLLDSRTAAGNVEHPLELAGVGRTERRRRVADLLDLVGLADRHESRPAQLSGGQKQRVAIARALAARPSVLLCDEATSALDPASTTGVLELLRQVRAELGLTVLLITHEMSVVRAVCDSAVLMSQGRVVDGGPLTEVLARPDSALAAQLVPAPAGPETGDGALVQLTVTDATPHGAVLQTLTAELGLSVEVVGGSVETVAGRRFGRLLLRVVGDDGRLDPALARLRAGGALVERTAAGDPRPQSDADDGPRPDREPDVQRLADAPDVQR